jgi:excisionase family DNA binding protein
MEKTKIEREWENPRESSEALGVCRSTIYNLITSGKLRAKKLGSRTLVSVQSRRELVAGLPDFTNKRS